MLFVKPLMFEYEPFKVANVSETGDVAKVLARTIALYEKQCLEEILGACLAKELRDSFEITTVDSVKAYRLKANATDAIKSLVNGKEYDAPSSTGSSFGNSDFFDYFLFGQGIIPFGCGCGCGGSECNKRYWKGFVETETILIGQAETTESKCFITDYVYYWDLFNNRSVTTGSGQQVLTGENSTPAQNFSKRIDAYNRFVDSVLGKRGQTSLYRFLYENKSDYPTWKPFCGLKYKPKY